MTHEEILKTAIEKAVKNGMNFFVFEKDNRNNEEWVDMLISLYDPKTLIFSHEFAKAFFGEEAVHDCTSPNCYLNDKFKFAEAWQLALQEMILCPCPIIFLRKFL